MTLPALAREFTPPDAATRGRAIGDTSKLAPALRKAFAPGPGFQPIPAPGPHDWLANQEEKGQTYDQFLAETPHRPTKDRGKLYFLPLGEFKNGPSLPQLQEFAQAFFGIPVQIRSPMSLKGLKVTSRERTTGLQLLAGDLMNLLSRRLPGDAYCQLGLTMVDLYPQESWNFVFGQASLSSHVGVYSFARYDPRFYGEKWKADSKTLVLTRSCAVLAHETCHMFGMDHCIYYSCLMNGSNHLQETDAAPLHLCPVCLRKLHYSAGFDPAIRYQRLEKCCRKLGLMREADWLDKMLTGR